MGNEDWLAPARAEVAARRKLDNKTKVTRDPLFWLATVWGIGTIALFIAAIKIFQTQ